MSQTDKVLESLRELESDLVLQYDRVVKDLNKVRMAIHDLTQDDESVSKNFSDLVPMSRPFSTRKKPRTFPVNRIKQLIKEGYNDNWTYTKKIMFLLATNGSMFIPQMADEIQRLTNTTFDDKKYRDIKLRLGYQAALLADDGLINRKRGEFGKKIQYWIPEDKLPVEKT